MSTSGVIPSEWRAARRVLAIRLDNLGDMLLATPALHAIKQSLPGIALSLLASPVGAQVARLNPDIDEVIVHESPLIDPWCRLPHDSERELRLIATLNEHHFDGAIIFTSFRQSPLPAAYLCYLADIPLRLAASIDGSGSLLTTRHKHPDRSMHEVERGLSLVGAIGCRSDVIDLVLSVPEQARAVIDSWRLPDDRPLIVVHPGCSMPARTYPWERYAEVVDLLAEQLGASIVLTGSEEERALISRIWQGVRSQNRAAVLPLAGALEFADLCALIERANVMITNNTGPMHIAAAVKTPVVALFALTNPPEQWRPWRVPHRLLYQDVACRLCYNRICPYEHECLTMIAPWMVVQAAGKFLVGQQREVGGSLSAHGARRPNTPPKHANDRSNLAQDFNSRLGPDTEVDSEEFGWRVGAAWRLGGER
jgi:lipopolysaccharide heptosyltransferase II